MNLINIVFLGLVVLFSVLGLTVSPFLLLGSIFVAIVFLILRRGGILKDQDEMQEFLDYKSGYYSFYFLIILATMFMILKLLQNPTDVPPDLAVIILLPLIFKFAIQSFEYRNYRKAGFIISLLPGLFWFIFVILEYISQGFNPGFFIEIIPVAAVIVFSVMGLRFPRISGAVFLVISFFFLFILARSNLPAMTKIGVISFLPLPLILSGFFYIFSMSEETLNG